MKKTVLIIIILTVLSKFIGLSRELVLAFYYGTTTVSDAYLVSWTIPMIIFSFIGSGIATAYIPLFININEEKGIERANQFTINLINVVILFCTVLILFGLVFTEPIVRLFASGFNDELVLLTVQFTKISLFGIYFSAIVRIFSAYLQINNNYVVPALSGFPMNFGIIVFMYLSSKGNLRLLPIGILVALMLQFIFLLPFVIKKGLRYEFRLNIKSEYMMKMIYLALPVVIGVAVNDINTIVDKSIASQLSEGSISALNYAQRINGFVQGIVTYSMATVMYPIITKLVSSKKINELKNVLNEAISGVLILVIPCSFGIIVFSRQITEFVFGRGLFDNYAIDITSEAMLFYSIGIIGVALREILSRPFYAMQDTKTPVINSSIGMIINIVLNLILSRVMGIGGIALATSISAVITTVLLYFSLTKKIGVLSYKEISGKTVKIAMSSVVICVLAVIVFNFLTIYVTSNLALMIAIVVSIVVYFPLLIVLRIEDVTSFAKLIKNKVKG